MAALHADGSRSGSRHPDRTVASSKARKARRFPGLFLLGTDMTLSRDWLAVIAAALLILLVKLGIASGIPW
jgi:hypothetical protein